MVVGEKEEAAAAQQVLLLSLEVVLFLLFKEAAPAPASEGIVRCNHYKL